MTRQWIMIHHSLTKDSGTVSWWAIEKYHREDPEHGYRDISYHAGIELVGTQDAGRYAYQALLGRPWHEQAAACPQGDMNRLALHVCCVGNFDAPGESQGAQGPPPLALYERLVQRIVLPWMIEFGIPADHIVGHRDYNPKKSCPGTQFDLGLLRRMVR